jgi:hypothetical protein
MKLARALATLALLSGAAVHAADLHEILKRALSSDAT